MEAPSFLSPGLIDQVFSHAVLVQGDAEARSVGDSDQPVLVGLHPFVAEIVTQGRILDAILK